MSVPSLPHSESDHDEYLIARLAAGELGGREAESARALVAQCTACAELLSDLVAISAATAVLPAPRRTRDFRVTAEDAARLRRTGWRRLVALFGEPRFAFTRPLATGLAALGVVGLILGSLPSGFGPGSAAAPALRNNDLLPQAAPASGGSSDTGSALSGAAPSAAPSVAPAAGEGMNPPYRTTASPAPVPDQAGSVAPNASGDKSSEFGPVSTPPTATSQPAQATAPQSGSLLAARDAGGSGPPPLTVLSLGLLVAGLLLVALRVVARRI